MPEAPPSSPDGRGGRLERCIRDLAALNALPSMCVGRSPEEALEIVLDALPTALDCVLVVLTLPGSPPRERGSLDGKPLSEAELALLNDALASLPADAAQFALPAAGTFFHLAVELPIGNPLGRLLAARRTPLDPETDRVLVRSAANLVDTTLRAAEVLEAARRRDEFLAILGHELRNPLAPIMTAVELLGRHPSAARERKVIERNTQHLVRLVDDLLDISRVTSGHVELRNEQLTLDSLLERAVEIATPLIARHRHQLAVAGGEGIALRGDPVRLAQVFANLLNNAAKFTPPGGRIEVSVTRMLERVRVVVRDNGCGIARDQLGRIFEPFVQAERERHSLHGGLGLGLAIVRNLVERHGGSVTAESDGIGRGAAFCVELPTVMPRVESVPVLETPAASVRAGVRVLVVDDNVDLAELLSEALRHAGFQTAIEHDAHAALLRWRSFMPHAAVLDVGLPELDGYELAKTLRAEHGLTPTLIAATGYGQKNDRLRAADAGFDCHFVKPVSISDIVSVLDRAVHPGAAPSVS